MRPRTMWRMHFDGNVLAADPELILKTAGL